MLCKKRSYTRRNRNWSAVPVVDTIQLRHECMQQRDVLVLLHKPKWVILCSQLSLYVVQYPFVLCTSNVNTVMSTNIVCREIISAEVRRTSLANGQIRSDETSPLVPYHLKFNLFVRILKAITVKYGGKKIRQSEMTGMEGMRRIISESNIVRNEVVRKTAYEYRSR